MLLTIILLYEKLRTRILFRAGFCFFISFFIRIIIGFFICFSDLICHDYSMPLYFY